MLYNVNKILDCNALKMSFIKKKTKEIIYRLFVARTLSVHIQLVKLTPDKNAGSSLDVSESIADLSEFWEV